MCLYVGREGFNRQQRFKKKRRKRTIFTCEQLSRLESRFADQQYVVGAERQQLAEALNLSETQVGMSYSCVTGKHCNNVYSSGHTHTRGKKPFGQTGLLKAHTHFYVANSSIKNSQTSKLIRMRELVNCLSTILL